MADTLPEAEGKTPARVDENLIKLEAKSVMLERRRVRTLLEEKWDICCF